MRRFLRSDFGRAGPPVGMLSEVALDRIGDHAGGSPGARPGRGKEDQPGVWSPRARRSAARGRKALTLSVITARSSAVATSRIVRPGRARAGRRRGRDGRLVRVLDPRAGAERRVPRPDPVLQSVERLNHAAAWMVRAALSPRSSAALRSPTSEPPEAIAAQRSTTSGLL